MPYINIRVPHAVFDQQSKNKLAEAVTEAAARAEEIPNDPLKRVGTQVIIDEVGKGCWYAGGKTDALQLLIPVVITVQAPQGVLDKPRRASLVKDITKALYAILPDEERPIHPSIMILDVPEGHWGVGDQIWGLADHAKRWGYGHLQEGVKR